MNTEHYAKRTSLKFAFYTCSIVWLLLLCSFGSIQITSQAQAGTLIPNIGTTIAAIMRPRLTLTAGQLALQAATMIAGANQTNAAIQANAAATNLANLTITSLARTTTLTPSSTPTSSLTPSSTLTSTVAPTSPLGQTEAGQTVIANVNSLLTRTQVVKQTQTFEAAYISTVNSILIQTLGVTATPTPSLTPSITSTILGTLTPVGPTEAYQTLVANVKRSITLTAGAAQTGAYVATLEQIALQTMGMTSTPTPTATLSESDRVATGVRSVLTQTAQAQTTNAFATAFQATVISIIAQTNVARGTVLPTSTPTATATSATPLSQEQIAGTTVAQWFTQTAQAATIQAVFQATLNQWLTATASSLSTVTPTPTLGPTQQQATLNAIIKSTIEVQQTNIAATALQSTIAANINSYSTATAQAVRANLTQGLQPISIRNANALKPLSILKGHTASVDSLDFSPDGTRLVSAGEDNALIVWDVGATQQSTRSANFSKRYAVAYSPDGIHIASANADGTLRVWDSQANTEQIITRGIGTTILTSVAYSPDGSLLAAGGTDGQVRIWDVKTTTLQLSVTGHSGAVTSVRFSPDGLRLATSGTDGTIRLWETRTGNKIGLFAGSRIVQIAFSQDGSLIASANYFSTVTIRDAQTGATKATLNGHKGAVFSVSFSPDGSLLASASADSTVRIWDVKKGTALATLQGHTGGVNSVQFSSDGVRLASAGQDGTVRLWAIPQ